MHAYHQTKKHTREYTVVVDVGKLPPAQVDGLDLSLLYECLLPRKSLLQGKSLSCCLSMGMYTCMYVYVHVSWYCNICAYA